MGRFLNSRAVPAAPAGLTTLESRVTYSNPDVEPAGPPPVIVAEAPAPAMVRSSPVTTVGLYALCIYLIGGYATDLSYRLIGTKPYVTMISGIIVFLCFLVSGRALAALRTSVGKLWLGLGIWMCFSVVFSRWRGGSFEVLQVYLPKQHMVLFYMAAFALTIKQCRTVLRACILGGFVLILTCFFFGMPEVGSGRFTIPTNIYLSNPNDLAMQLLLCLGFFIFLIRQPGAIGRIGGALGAIGASYYLLATASRGGMLAAVVLVVLCVLFSTNRLRVLMLALPLMLVMAAVMPQETLRRLSLLGFGSAEVVTQVANSEQEKAVDSALEREHLFVESVKYAIKNPLFGIGPGRFADAIYEDGKKRGVHEASLGTHNTYTQIAAECGLPALIMFVGAIFMTIRSSYRLYRATLKDPEQSLVSSIAFMCFALGIAFSIDLCFHHVAYSGNMAMVLGIWVATSLTTRQVGMNTEATAASAG